MNNFYDVIIIGTGPAGLACAIELSKSNKKVLVLEKNSEFGQKVCAGGITSKIENLGIPLAITDKLFSQIKINTPHKNKFISNDKPFVGTIERKQLTDILLGKIGKNIEIHLNSRVTEIQNDYIEIDQEKVKYQYLVGADGSNSLVRKFIGIKTKKQKIALALQYLVPNNFENFEMFFNSHLFRTGYAWIFPHQNYTSIGCAIQNINDTTKLKNNFNYWIKQKNINIENTTFQSALINFDYQGYKFGNKFLAGDAGGFTSGLTGEGMYFALVSGQEIAKKILDPLYRCPKIKKVLAIKRKHEMLLNFMIFSQKIKTLNFCFDLLPLLFKTKLSQQTAIKLFS